MEEPIPSIDATIAAAVQARIQAEVVAALSGDAVIGQYVTAALQQQIEVDAGNYRRVKTTFLQDVLRRAMQEATKAAVAAVIIEQAETIEAEVRKCLRRNIAGIAETLTGSLVSAVEKPYGVKVDMELLMPRSTD